MDKRVIGIAGYSGSGKSTLAKIVSEKYALALVDVDLLAKDIMQRDVSIINEIEKQFGGDIISSKGINFGALGEKAFSSRENIIKLNSIVHPTLIRELKNCIEVKKSDGVIIDAALISYWGIEDWFDTLYWVKLSRELRFERVKERVSGLSDAELERRLDIQESLFNEPSLPWKTINNQSSVKDLYSAFLSLEENL